MQTRSIVSMTLVQSSMFLWISKGLRALRICNEQTGDILHFFLFIHKS